MDIVERRDLLDEFYELLDDLERRLGGKRLLETCNSRMKWPQRGVYFFFENDELREDGRTPRVVRVGTHALRPSSSTLWGRLAQHRGTDGGSMPGGGNHRGSIFRRHVGAALLAAGKSSQCVRETWGEGSTATRAVREHEYELERDVSNHIRRMSFLWLGVDDGPSPSSDRGTIERGAISLLSNLDRDVVDPCSPKWLGRSSDRRTIVESGVWNVNHVGESQNIAFLPVMKTWLAKLEL